MIPYWIMFFIPSLVALEARPIARYNVDGTRRVAIKPIWIFAVIITIALIGFRFEVGGDWFTYAGYLERGRFLSFADLFYQADPGYVALNIVAARLGVGMTGVNIASAMIFTAGLVVFLQTLPRPWLGLSCAIPYLVIVVAMGYTRQSVALGFVMLGLVALRRQRVKTFILWVILGALFHKTAVLLLPIGAMISTRARIQHIGLVGLAAFAAYDAFLARHAEQLIDVYIVEQLTSSQGAFVRLFMNAVPAALMLFFGRNLAMTPTDRKIWRLFSWIALFMLGAFFTTGFSTALDRMALYLIPLQLVLFSHLPDALGVRNRRNTTFVFLIVFYYALVQFVWLNFAAHAPYWLPYQMGFSLN